jgi:hypothetical protein
MKTLETKKKISYRSTGCQAPLPLLTKCDYLCPIEIPDYDYSPYPFSLSPILDKSYNM